MKHRIAHWLDRHAAYIEPNGKGYTEVCVDCGRRRHVSRAERTEQKLKAKKNPFFGLAK